MTAPVTGAGSPDDEAAGEREFLGVAGADIRMSHLEPELLAILRSVPAPAVLVTAERRVVAANTPHWISGTRLPRLPAAGDGDFAAVTEIGADSGWLLAAASAPAGDHLLLSAEQRANPPSSPTGPVTRPIALPRPPGRPARDLAYTVGRSVNTPPHERVPGDAPPQRRRAPSPAGPASRLANRRRRPHAHRGGLQRLRRSRSG